MGFFFAFCVLIIFVVLSKRLGARLLRAIDGHAARRGRLPPLWAFRQWLARPLWGFQRGPIILSGATACFCLHSLLTIIGPLSSSPFVPHTKVSAATTGLMRLYGAPREWLAPVRAVSLEERTQNMSNYPFPRLHLDYSGAGEDEELGGIIICDRIPGAGATACRLNLATPLWVPAGQSADSYRLPARLGLVLSSDGDATIASWHAGYDTDEPSTAAATLGGRDTTVRLRPPSPLPGDWLPDAAAGLFAPVLSLDWPVASARPTERYVFGSGAERTLIALFLRLSQQAGDEILVGHGVSQLRANVLADYVTILGHLDENPEIKELLAGFEPRSNDADAIARALARQPQLSTLYRRRDVHAARVYDALLRDLRETGLVP
ncbi:hypothetical protein SAMN06295905_2250 [Devosia lucknowensis]|uniref:Uncharacterized protein n=1 Tax=Devosia lucknowensis TaxID=1096929 RepID=A0A1Y6FE59_9HYPH|nr:hypothetical protein [Devosia lucknowensis]SMQ73067.1 hypothetical protein SAMN06295905_2250 [Devosia lucknowensis]